MGGTVLAAPAAQVFRGKRATSRRGAALLINRLAMLLLGSGQAAQEPTAAAIANAVFEAAGLRIRDLPIRPDKVHRRLVAQGGAL